jgi:hypothetical protein
MILFDGFDEYWELQAIEDYNEIFAPQQGKR